MVCAQAEILEQIHRRAGIAKAVVYTDLCHRNRVFTDCFAHCVAQAADDAVLFRCYNEMCLRDRCYM